jgi:fumarylacetoacetase
MSPWIVTLEALEPFRCAAFPRSGDQPAPLPYLLDEKDQREGGFDIGMEIHLRTKKMRSPVCLSRSNFRHAYWTPAQVVTHQASNGCNLQPGDLLGSGTISGPRPTSWRAARDDAGQQEPGAALRRNARLLEDGDQVILRGAARAKVACRSASARRRA